MLKSQGPIWGIRFQKCPAYGPTSIYAIGLDGPGFGVPAFFGACQFRCMLVAFAGIELGDLQE